MCVCERERERERVCVCMRERERERESEREMLETSPFLIAVYHQVIVCFSCVSGTSHGTQPSSPTQRRCRTNWRPKGERWSPLLTPTSRGMETTTFTRCVPYCIARNFCMPGAKFCAFRGLVGYRETKNCESCDRDECSIPPCGFNVEKM